MSKPLKSLQDFNADREASYEVMRKMREPHSNGIQCPHCGKELWDSNPCMTLTSNPPQKNIHCPSCNYIGYRLA